MKHRSLRIQITAAVGLIVMAACIVLTLHAISSADNHYQEFAQELQGFAVPDYDASAIEQDSVTVSDVMLSFSYQSLAVMELTIAVSVLFTWWITGRLLRPLEQLTQTMREIDEQKLHQPLKAVEGASEVRQLTDSFNGMLRRLDESFSIQRRFAADAAHELKTPLTAMKVSLQVLQLDKEPSYEEYQEFAEDTEESLERLIHTVDSLLALSGKEMNQETEPVDLRETAELAAEKLAAKAARQSVRVTVAGDPMIVTGSPTLFYRALYNGMDNAIKYNRPNGTVEVSIRKEGQWAQVTISDTGIGISAEQLSSVFDAFYRADPSRSQQIEGSGLGLAIVRQILERYGGRAEMTSAYGSGSRLTLWFPVGKSENQSM